MNIALISEHASPAALLGGVDAGGQNVYVDEIAGALADLGNHVDVFTRKEHATAADVQPWTDGVRIVNLPAGPPCPIGKDDIWPFMPSMRDQLVRFMHQDRIRYDLTHGNFWMSGWVAAELRRRRSIPAVQLFHALGVTKRLHQAGLDTSPAERIAVERQVICDVDRVIATCPDEAHQLQAHYGAAADRIALIPLGVDNRLFRPIDRELARSRIGLGLRADDYLLVYVGRLVPRKDVRNVIEALALLPLLRGRMIKLLVVGGETAVPDPESTPEIGQLLRVAAQAGVADRVIFAGKRDRFELPYYYAAGDVMVTTPWYEPFGLTPLEAMACARPVIGSDVGGISFSVEHGSSGLLVPPKDSAALAASISTLMANRELATSMGQRGWVRVQTQFTWPIVAQRTAKLYADVLEQVEANRRSIFAVGDVQAWRDMA
jgi:D-inositol-3-phosphate glycosyltransferase